MNNNINMYIDKHFPRNDVQWGCNLKVCGSSLSEVVRALSSNVILSVIETQSRTLIEF